MYFKLCIYSLIVYACVRIRNGGFCESRRPFLCIWNMYYYQQRCVDIILNQKYHIPNQSIIVCAPERNGALHCAAHFCVNGICIFTNNVVFIKYRTQNLTPIPSPQNSHKPSQSIPEIFHNITPVLHLYKII